MKIQRLIDYLAGRAPRKRALEDKEKALKAYREEKNCLMTENKFLKEEKDVLEAEKNKQYQTIQGLLDNEKQLKEQILHLVEKTNRLEIRLESATQRADGLLKEVESWKYAALKADKDMKEATQKQNKKKKTQTSRVIGKCKGIKRTGATGEGVKLNKQ